MTIFVPYGHSIRNGQQGHSATGQFCVFIGSIEKRGQRTPDNGQTMEKTDNDGKDGQRWKRRTTMEKTDNDGKDGPNDGKDGQTMEKTDKRWKRRTNDGKTNKRWRRWTRFLIHRPFMNI